MKKILKCLILIFILHVLEISLNAQQYPKYVTGGVPINDYTLFANTGWDGNWYVGYNMCWIKRFTTDTLPENLDSYAKVYIGAKLGRAKIQQKHNSAPWEKEFINGKIYVGLSSTPTWKFNQRYFLCLTKDIPSEGDFENAITTTGEARWFYTEVSLKDIDFNSDVWVCLYSDTEYLTSVSSAPILAGGWRERGQKDTNVWINNQIKGAPPLNINNSLTTGIRAFDAAIVLKFIPKEKVNVPVEIIVSDITNGRKDTEEKVFFISAITPNIERLWMEVSQDQINWTRISKYIYQQPYSFNLSLDSVPKEIYGDFYLRFAANDIFENVGYTSPIQLNISRVENIKSDPKQQKNESFKNQEKQKK